MLSDIEKEHNKWKKHFPLHTPVTLLLTLDGSHRERDLNELRDLTYLSWVRGAGTFAHLGDLALLLYLFHKLLWRKSLHYSWLKHSCCKMVIYVMYCCITNSIILLSCKLCELWQGVGQVLHSWQSVILSRTSFVLAALHWRIYEMAHSEDVWQWWEIDDHYQNI